MKALALALVLAACGGSKQPSAAAPEPAPAGAPAPSDQGSGIATGSNDTQPGQTNGSATVPAPGSCAAAGGRCENKLATIACASQPPANDCGANEFCCKM